MHEAQMHASSWFATFTYADEFVPEHGSLDKTDVQKFFKRLRRRIPGVRYYYCGEYGDQTQRPHYHAALMGPQFLDREEFAHRSGAPVFKSELLEDTWKLGLTEITPLSSGGARYICGYLQKKVRNHGYTSDGRDPWANAYTRVDPVTGELHDVQEEFADMSRRPGIGRSWIEKYWAEVYPRDFVVMDGQPMNPPKYYDRWMEENLPEMMEEVRHQRFLDSEYIDEPKLIMKAKIHRARLGLHSPRRTL